MKAAVWHGAKDIRVEDVDLKPTKDNEVVVKVAWTGICGSDLHEYQEDQSSSRSATRIN